MRSFAVLFLAAAAVTAFKGDHGADRDDSWPIGEIAETATLIVDRISEAKRFLADLSDDDFDFKQWYDQQLEDFRADQDNVAYDDKDDQKEDFEDFKQQLDAISTEFAAAQGEDYANFVRDIIGEGIDHLHDQAQELLARMRETAQEINDLEEQEFDLYIQLGKISCVKKTESEYLHTPKLIHIEGAPDYIDYYGPQPANSVQSDYAEWPRTPISFDHETYDIADGFKPWDELKNELDIKHRSTCYLAAIYEELDEYYTKYTTKAHTSAAKNKWRRKIQKKLKEYRDWIRKWDKLYHTFGTVNEKEEHERHEYDTYEQLLKASQELQEFGLEGSDALVLDDSLVGDEFAEQPHP